MMGLSWSRITPPETSAPKALREARTCYDHLAGTVAVQIYDFMQAQGWLETDGSALTVYGREQFLTLGISLSANPRRKACCACLDWSERRFHLGARRARRFSRIWTATAGSSGWRDIGTWWSPSRETLRLKTF